MGMFDHVECRVPLPDGYVSPDGYQTKSFDNQLEVYIITEGGLLERRGGWLCGDPDPDPVIVPFHGCFRFYADEPAPPGMFGAWHEYEARFTDGRLVRIDVVPER